MASLFLLLIGIAYSTLFSCALLMLLSVIAKWAGWESPKEEVVSPAPTPHKEVQAPPTSHVTRRQPEKESKSRGVPLAVPPHVSSNEHNTPAANTPKVLRSVHLTAIEQEKATQPPETSLGPSSTKVDVAPYRNRDPSLELILERAERQRIPFTDRIEDAIKAHSEARTRRKRVPRGSSPTCRLKRRRLIQFVEAAVHTSQPDLVAGFPGVPAELIAKYMDLDYDIREAAARWIRSSYCRTCIRSAARPVPKRPSEWDTDMSGASSSWDMIVRSYEDLGTEL